MSKKLDLKGFKTGMLEVIKESNFRIRENDVTWECICDCNNLCFATTEDLRRKKNPKRSCGCIVIKQCREMGKANQKEQGKAGLKRLYVNYKYSCKKYKRLFNINIDVFEKLTSSNCHYCNSPPKQIMRVTSRTKGEFRLGDYLYNGLDRIDSNKGYTLKNVLPCCKLCNFAKRTTDYKTFLEWIKNVYNHIYKL